MHKAATTFAAVLFSSLACAAQSYSVDAARSTLGFTATQTGAKFPGRFEKFTAKITFSPDDLAGSRFEVLVQTASVNTEDEDRDTALRGADLLSVEKYPQAKFVSSKFERSAEGGYQAVGDLTLRDVTRQIRVPFSFEQSREGGKTVAMLKGTAQLKRLDFGVGQGEWQDTIWVGNDVGIDFSLRLSPAAPAAPEKKPALPPASQSK